ncbi:MAG: sulfite exporter TauE/SafE family protein [Oscillospiraceae bacterium]|nr:sulfite exporter TauE/SafE family protein [Oscillospiraceae bacterium]
MLLKFTVCFIAGIGAGLGTGFAGMSAAAVISPMLITFLHMEPYMAVGIALASDVLASAVSAYTYHKNKNLDVKNGLVMMATVLVFTLVGSWIASLVPQSTMGSFSVFMTMLLGIKFIVKPVMTTKEAMEAVAPKKRVIQSVLCGMVIGFICGFIGAGGGMMMLLILTTVLGYELKTAVGTSVFIMAFTAFTGAVSHFAIGGMPDLWSLIFCVGSTLLWARVAARFANKAEPRILNRATGAVLVILGVVIIGVNYLT